MANSEVNDVHLRFGPDAILQGTEAISPTIAESSRRTEASMAAKSVLSQLQEPTTVEKVPLPAIQNPVMPLS
jgi:hypothetical protein